MTTASVVRLGATCVAAILVVFAPGAEVEDATRLKLAVERSIDNRSSRVAVRPIEELQRTDELAEVVVRPNRDHGGDEGGRVDAEQRRGELNLHR